MRDPFLSVVMPVHEGADWIRATLESVAAAGSSDTEIIVIDSSLTDATADIVRGYSSRLPLQLLRRPDLSPWQTKTNIGVELSSAAHVCILHQDDLWLPCRIKTIRRWISDTSDATLHLAPTLIIDGRSQRVGRWTCPLPAERPLEAEFFLERLLVQNFVSVPAPVFQRRAWLDCGGMDEKLWYTPDWDIWAQLSGEGSVVYHHDVTTAFRVHGNSLTITGTRDLGELRTQMEAVVERHIHRIPPSATLSVERAARASIDVNVSLAAASAGNTKLLFDAARQVLSLGPGGMRRYFAYSRLRERVIPRLRAKMMGSF